MANLLESFDKAKLEQLVRLGLLPIKILPVLKRALTRLEKGIMLNPEDRHALSLLTDKILKLTLDDSAVFQRLRIATTKNRMTKMESKIQEGEELKRTPEGMLDTITRNIRAKKAAGGKISILDKRMASQAKSELRRRRDVRKKAAMRKQQKENYEQAFNAILNSYEITNIASLSNEQIKEFFNKVELLYNSGE